MQHHQRIDGDIEDDFVYNIYITDKIYELELFDLMRLTISVDTTSLSYMDGYLFHYTVVESVVNMKKRLLIRDVITEVYYAKIGAFHKFILFDDLHDLCKLIDTPEELEYHGETTQQITIIKTLDWITLEIYNKIIGEKNDERKAK